MKYWLLPATVWSVLAQSPADLIRFSGYEWEVKTSQSPAGPGPNYFGRDGVWVDSEGRLHLRIRFEEGRWTCAEVINRKSLGLGAYTFVVDDTSHLDPQVVLGLFTWDSNAPQENYREIDVEVSRWTEPANSNGQFVLKARESSDNIVRFEVPPGIVSHSFLWAASQVRFWSLLVPGGRLIREHTFSEGIPAAGSERARINLWLAGGQPPSNGQPAEVVIREFSFRPPP